MVAFGRTVHALCTISSLLHNGLLRMGELPEQAEDTFTHEYVVGFRPRSKLVDICSGEHESTESFNNFFK